MYYGIGSGTERNKWYFHDDHIASARVLTVNAGKVEAWGHVAGFGSDSGALKVEGGEVNLHCWTDYPETHWEHPYGIAGLWLMDNELGKVIVSGGTLNVWGGGRGGILLGHESQMTVTGGKVEVEAKWGPAIGNDGKGPNVDIYGGEVWISRTDLYNKGERFIGGKSGKDNGRLVVHDGMAVHF